MSWTPAAAFRPASETSISSRAFPARSGRTVRTLPENHARTGRGPRKADQYSEAQNVKSREHVRLELQHRHPDQDADGEVGVPGQAGDAPCVSWRARAAALSRTRRAAVSCSAHPMSSFDTLIDKARASNPHADTGLLRRAYDFSAAEHAGQKRRSGEPLPRPSPRGRLPRRRHAARRRGHRGGAAARRRRGHPDHHRARARPVRPRRRPRRGGGSPRSAPSRSRRARSGRRRTSARCCSPWSTTSASSS